MVDEVAVVEVDRAVATLEAIERFAVSLFLSAVVVVEAHLLVYLPRLSLRGFEVGLDINLAAQGNRKQRELRLT